MILLGNLDGLCDTHAFILLMNYATHKAPNKFPYF